MKLYTQKLNMGCPAISMSVVLIWLFVTARVGICVSARLMFGFYDNDCPRAESLVRSTLAANVLFDPTAPAAMLRLAFHDCQVKGCDASILLRSTGRITSEMVSDRNFGIRRLDLIDRIKSTLELACPGVVSCADIIALAARDAVSLTGGPNIQIPTGRRDGTFASNLAADALVPPATVNMHDFLQVFNSKGMTVAESVAMLGAHTLGVGHCVSIINRLYPTRDNTLGFGFGGQLRLTCPTPYPAFINNNTFMQNDLTNVFFDNQYFRDLMVGRGLFSIDSEVANDPTTSQIVSAFAQNQNLFFSNFASAFVKLTASNVLTGDQGEVRRNCAFVN
ncbi:hypothetical protein O6H91_20G045700 [Diphasiastrum complanatum]|uniref:Uncharacterized protein n=1 Tax=Diphasiastrum complanatum TaxID=34168 RepID=A0ACC2AQ02_DIPCM|nr:hypothetical protein O6H91_20G045700 [Diphasiastrum complanatum]